MSNKSLGSKLDSAFTEDEIKEINEYGEKLKQITTFINQYDGGNIQPYVFEKIYNEFILPLEKRLEEAEKVIDFYDRVDYEETVDRQGYLDPSEWHREPSDAYQDHGETAREYNKKYKRGEK